jgi:hypothetical protein
MITDDPFERDYLSVIIVLHINITSLIMRGEIIFWTEPFQ